MKSVMERIESLSIPEPNSGCWLWLGTVDDRKYPRIVYRGRNAKAHRVAWEVTNGPIPGNRYICHRCDVPLCVNPKHLFLGTPKDNVRDMMNKGRQNLIGLTTGRHLGPHHVPKGERCYLSKVTAKEVREIRADKRSGQIIAREYAISKSQVNKIRSRRDWKHLRDAT